MTLRRDALLRTQALASSVISGVTGYKPAAHQNARIVERIVKIYEAELASLRRGHNGSRMKAETKRIMNLDVGDAIEIEATCRANIVGQMKTIRRRLDNDALKYRLEQLTPTRWRVLRRPDGCFNLGKDADRNPKAVFLAQLLPDDGWHTYPGIVKCNQICNDFTKNKARTILKNMDAEWVARTGFDGEIRVRRTR